MLLASPVAVMRMHDCLPIGTIPNHVHRYKGLVSRLTCVEPWCCGADSARLRSPRRPLRRHHQPRPHGHLRRPGARARSSRPVTTRRHSTRVRTRRSCAREPDCVSVVAASGWYTHRLARVIRFVLATITFECAIYLKHTLNINRAIYSLHLKRQPVTKWTVIWLSQTSIQIAHITLDLLMNSTSTGENEKNSYLY